MSLLCGWDGGGTRTRVLVTDAQGHELGLRCFGPMNLNGNEPDVVRGTVWDAVDCMRSFGPVDILVVGMAGASNSRTVETVTDMIREAGYAGRLTIVSDLQIALMGGVKGPGAVLVAGTGSACCGFNCSGEFIRVGGFGHLVDDEGSGYAIGRGILQAVLRSQDGRGPDTLLAEAVRSATGAEDIRALIAWIYDPRTGKRDVAALAGLLPDAVAKGDAAALAVQQQAVRGLQELVVTLWRRASLTQGSLILVGGVLERMQALRERLIQCLSVSVPGLTVTKAAGSPAEGAIRMAMSQLKE